MKRIVVLALAVLFVLAGCKPLWPEKMNTTTTGGTTTTTTRPSNGSTTTTTTTTTSGSGGQTTTTSSTAPTARTLRGKVVNVRTVVNIRSAPSSAADVLGQAQNGAEFVVLTENHTQGWHQIEFEGQTGYISADYFEIIR